MAETPPTKLCFVPLPPGGVATSFIRDKQLGLKSNNQFKLVSEILI